MASPNCDERPPETVVDLVVIHGISLPPGQFGGPWIDALFTNTLSPRAHPYFEQLHGLRVSSHLLIRRRGEVIQYVPLHRRAWHAGVSRFEGRERCNDFSIGIELEGADHRPYTEAQYRRLLGLLRAIMVAYPAVTPARIVGHCHVAPGRKSDPGPVFDWQRLHVELCVPGSEDETLCISP
ncbi:N-acetylmuramoyl-L-alanine amidase, family 2 [Nitrococcus mobilis Nb-231]|uniref:1,6-anhydro-N-acetylmuramyl-L-alanine amidase AmpD n=1 Tax=Nitrococcus mobilis Nb-231 TaxID=314278 RepID=A4BU74_9GAMM|nr:N-acetylmuramoyl-L-alanine amidase, family 2 [Nitrococcus mobilis Nb-231]